MNILIADDEKSALTHLKKILLQLKPEAKITEAQNGLEALEIIEKNKPDLIFLDIKMPRLSGLEVANSITSYNPSIIFTTAHEKHAIEAFELNALDYILKPFEQERIEKALNKANKEAAKSFPSSNFSLHRISLRSELKYKIYEYSKIIYIVGDRNYLNLYHQKGFDKVVSTLDAIESKLPSDIFLRIHRSHIVNIAYLKEIYKNKEGKYVASLSYEDKEIILAIGKNKIDRVKNAIGH